MELSQNDRAELKKLVELIRQMANRGELPATGGNFSLRPEHDKYYLVSESGVYKPDFLLDNFTAIDKSAQVIEDVASQGRKSSAETLLHVMILEQHKDVRCVLHSHMLSGLIYAQLHVGSDCGYFENMEMIKAFRGFSTHLERARLPIFENSQNMPELVEKISPMFAQTQAQTQTDKNLPGFLLRGHGLYTWGRSFEEARNHLEAFQYLFEYYERKNAVVKES